MGSSKMRSMETTYIAVVLLLALAIPSRSVQLVEQMEDVAQKNEEKVPVLVDRTSTMIRNPRIFFPLTTSTKTATTTGSVTLCMVTTTTMLRCQGFSQVSSSQLLKGTMMKRRSTLTSRATSSTPMVNFRETQGLWCIGQQS